MSFLMRLAWHGQMRGVIVEAAKIALDSCAGHYARQTAIRVIMSLGNPTNVDQVFRDFRNLASELDRNLIGEFVNGLVPTTDAIDWLLDAVPKASPHDRHQVDELGHALTRFVQKCGLEFLLKLIAGCEPLIKTPPFIEIQHCEVSTNFQWLLKSLGLAIQRLLLARCVEALTPPVLSILQCLASARAYGGSEINDPKLRIDELVSEWPELNLALFWFHIEEARRQLDRNSGERLTDYWKAGFWHSCVALDKIAFNDIIPYVRLRDLMDDRLVALSLAFHAYIRAEKPDAMLLLLQEAACQPELKAALDLLLNPPPLSEEDKKLRQYNFDLERDMKKQKQQYESDKAKLAHYVIKNMKHCEIPTLPIQRQYLRYSGTFMSG